MRFNSRQIVSYCLGLHKQKPRLREIVTRSTCWNKKERPQKKTSHIVQRGLTYGSQHLERWNCNPVLRKEPIKTKALVSFYWLSQSLHLKEPPNWTSQKSTKEDPIRLSWTWIKSDQISKSYPVQHIKNFPKNTRSTNAYD